MAKQKSTKRALIASGLALFMCISMFVGSTFAWFTDSVKTGVNTIQAGTLDIVLEYKDANGVWQNAEGKTLSFKAADNRTNILWEPGCTYELPAIRVRNNGNLALKYNMVVNGIEGDSKLLEVIDFTYAGDEKKPVANFSGILLPDVDAKKISEEIVIKGHMRETAGNEYQDLSISGLGITVFATQLTYEVDSKDDQYDKMATIDDIDELKAALAEDSVKIVLGDHIALTEVLTIEAGKEVAIDLCGFIISGVDTASLYSLIHVKNGASLTITDTIGTGKVTYDAGAGKTGAAIWNEGALVLDSGIIEITGEWSIGFAVDSRPNAWGSNYTEPTTFTMNGGAIVASDSGVRVANYSAANAADSAVFTMNGGKIDSVYDAVFVQHVVACDLKVVINDGILNSTTHALRIYGTAVNDVYVTVAGGEFNGKLTNWDVTGNGTATITGGTFNVDPSAYVAEGYAVAKIGKNTWKVVKGLNAVAAQAALTNAADGAVIELAPGVYYGDLVMSATAKNVTIKCVEGGALLDSLNINGASGATVSGLTFDAAGATDAYDKSTRRQAANIVGASKGGNVGARNLVIDNCVFTGEFAAGGAAIAFTDRSRPTGGSGNVTIQNCTFDTEGAYYDVYAYYTGYTGLYFKFVGNTFASETAGTSIYLLNLASSEDVVVEGNTFAAKANLDEAVYVKPHSASYTPSVVASNNVFGN